jgi:hypothetical protein
MPKEEPVHSDSELPPSGSVWRDFVDWLKRLAGGVATFAEIAATVIVVTVDIVGQADLIARKYRWGLSTSWPLALIAELGAMAAEQKPRIAFDRRIVAFYRTGGWAELDKLVENICSYASVHAHRKNVLRQTVILFRASEAYDLNPALFAQLVLFAQLEGILGDYAAEEGLLITRKPKKTITVRSILPALKKHASAVERPALRLIGESFKNYYSKAPPKGKRRSHRHWNMHGKIKSQAGYSDAIKLILAIDLVAYLADKSRCLTRNEGMDRRHLYGGFLSQTSEIAKKVPLSPDDRQRYYQNVMQSSPMQLDGAPRESNDGDNSG